jgi:ferrous iron transport protein B
MSRVVFLMDKIMRNLAYQAKVLCLLFREQQRFFPAIMATRNIENWKND